MENWFQRFLKRLKEDRKTQIITLIIIGLVALAVCLGYYFWSGKEWKLTELKKPKKELEGLVPRKLDGVLVKPENANPYPIAVMIENLITVRPQSGLSAAGVVYEALAEGGITRFMAVYAGEEAEKIGPVRSSRAYYLEWASEYDALYVFSGAYPPVLAAISGLKIKNLNAMYEGSKYFWRDRTVAAPHNLFTSSEKLGYGLRDKELNVVTPTYASWKFKDDAELDVRPQEEKAIKIHFSSVSYEVEYKYDRESNSYLRFNGGVPHKDRNTNDQLRAKNIVVLKLPTKVIDEKGRLEMDVTGEGEAYMFTDGKVYEGRWKKPSRTERTRFYHQDGKEHEFVRGQTWIEVIPLEKTVEYN